MAGEFAIAQRLINDALAEVENNKSMSTDAMQLAIFNEIVGLLANTNSREQLQDLLHFRLAAQGQDEHVITRGC
ncbi:MAG: hypothetical protein AseanaTS_18830 [Candidatus Pelagadaptatus aseana]|uniref:hypothetical protein n=1 Tax=Candidatus Pelagadaptatus aseana TaxID=3120508 RepID=UPI0039B1B5C1